jgi:hypothetical protein
MDRKPVSISLKQKGGVFGGDRQVDLAGAEIEVKEGGQSVAKRRLSDGEAQRLDDVAQRLIASSPPQEASAGFGHSDSILTEVNIGDASDQRTYRVRSGDDAPAELWELVGAISEMADAQPTSPPRPRTKGPEKS